MTRARTVADTDTDTDTGTRTDTDAARQLAQFRTVFDQSATGMATMTLEGRIVRANSALTSIAGPGRPKIVGTEFAALSPEPGRRRLREAVVLARSCADATVTIDHAIAGGRPERLCRSTVAPMCDDHCRVLYLFVQVEDLTPARAATERLRASEERFRLFVESVKDYAIFMLDTDGRVVTWNAGAERMKGYAADEIIGQHFRVFFPKEAQRSHHPEDELEMAARAGRYDEEGWRVRKDGSRFYANVAVTALFDESGALAGFGKVTRDVTEQQRDAKVREQVASELATANEILRANAKAMSDFTAVIAHELRSPVTAITGAAGLLRQHADRLADEDRAELLAGISQGGARLLSLIGDLVTASHLETGSFELQLEDLSIGSLLVEVLAETASVAPVHIEHAGRSDLVVHADRARVGQIVTNLVHNAVRHGLPPVAVAVEEAGHFVELRVFDEGPGVPRAIAGRLFEQFVQGSAGEGHGSGLGLYIVRELARAQGGVAWYERPAGARTCFAVRLPKP